MPSVTKSQGTLVVVLLILLLASTLANVVLALGPKPVYLSQPVELSKEEAPAWEYRIEAVPDLAWDSVMGNIGTDGWELVFARRAQGSDDKMMYETIFKRQKQN
jgi:hypothetical protein